MTRSFLPHNPEFIKGEIQDFASVVPIENRFSCGSINITPLLTESCEEKLGCRHKLEVLFRDPAHLEFRSAGTQLLLAKWTVKDSENSFGQRFVITDRYQWAKGPLLENLGRPTRAVCADNRTSTC